MLVKVRGRKCDSSLLMYKIGIIKSETVIIQVKANPIVGKWLVRPNCYTMLVYNVRRFIAATILKEETEL